MKASRAITIWSSSTYRVARLRDAPLGERGQVLDVTDRQPLSLETGDQRAAARDRIQAADVAASARGGVPRDADVTHVPAMPCAPRTTPPLMTTPQPITLPTFTQSRTSVPGQTERCSPSASRLTSVHHGSELVTLDFVDDHVNYVDHRHINPLS
jgi:hypothetical protein